MTLRTNLAQQWRNWKLNQLRMEIEIQEGLLRVARSEYAGMNRLAGSELQYRFGCETAADLAPFNEDRKQWRKQVEDLFIEAERQNTGRRGKAA